MLGAIADYTAVKKRLLAVFLAIGAAATAAMFWIGRGDWQFALVLFVIGNVGVAGSIVFYESLLPHLVPERDWIGSRRPATPSATWAAACCWPSTC